MKLSWPWNSSPAGDIRREASPSIGHSCMREQPLEGQVVHGEYRARLRRPVLGNVGAGHRRMPVVGVHDVGRPLRIGVVGREVGGHPAQQGKALQVVGPLLALAVLVGAAAAAVEVGRVDHVHRQLAARHARQQQPHAQRAEAGADVDRRCVRPARSPSPPAGRAAAGARRRPAPASAAGSAATTSARPPVLTSGKTSAATCRTFMPLRPSEPAQHVARDQGDARLGAEEALRRRRPRLRRSPCRRG